MIGIPVEKEYSHPLEPLVTNPRLIAVDLEGTLIKPFEQSLNIVERFGATRLLRELQDRGYDSVLMSTATIPDEYLFSAIPEWKSLIKRTLWRPEIHFKQQEFLRNAWISQLLQLDKPTFDVLHGILDGYSGGKYPPLFGIGGGIIDDVVAHIAEGPSLLKLGDYGFRVFDPRNKMGEDDTSELWVDRVLQQIDGAEQTKNFFPIDVLKKWAKEVERCDGKHENFYLLEKVRKITTNDEFNKLRNSRNDYLIPNASWASVPGVERDMPRGFIQDVILYAEIMVYSKLIQHGLSASDLETLYKHHCVEPMIAYGKANGMVAKESLITLRHYIDRIVTQVHLLADNDNATPQTRGPQ